MAKLVRPIFVGLRCMDQPGVDARSVKELPGAMARIIPGWARLILIVVFAGRNQVGAIPPTFDDVTLAAQVDYVQFDGTIPDGLESNHQELLFMTGGAVAGDFDGDGWVDLFATRLNASNQFFRNLGTGQFEEVGLSRGLAITDYCNGCAAGDIDNDGDLDIYVVTVAPGVQNYLFINDGTGNFSEQGIPRGVSFTQPGDHQFTSPSFGDYDLDGHLDLMVTEWSFSLPRTRLLRNDGRGNFRDVTDGSLPSPLSLIFGFTPKFGDVTGDGWPDILLAADFGSSQLLVNQQDGTFLNTTGTANVATDENGMGAALGDVDGDGDLDWFVTSIFDPDVSTCGAWGVSGNRMYLNQGSGTFTDGTDFCGVRHGYWGWGASFLDFDNDGDLDLGMTNGMALPFGLCDDPFNANPVRFWENDGSGAMTEVSVAANFTDARSGKGFLVFDFDRDGDQDVFIVNNADHPVLYENIGGNSNHWLNVTLNGQFTNRFGIGARIVVQQNVAGPELMHEVSASSNFLSQNEVTAHFGLGQDTSLIATVTVQWPRSGRVTVLNNVAIDQTVEIREVGATDCVDDGNLDLSDWTCFAAYLASPGQTADPLAIHFDTDLDNDLDLRDYAIVQIALTHP